MKFMNKKEQVLDIQLTPYGEHALSQGQFKPEYYSFYDDNILYESQYSGYVDSQNSIEPRTQENTPQLETQVVFSNRDIYSRRGFPDLNDELTGLSAMVNLYGFSQDLITEYTSIQQSIGGGNYHYGNITDNFFEQPHYGLKYCLGRSDILKTDAPAWSISMLRGEISGSVRAITGSNIPTINIPQLNCTLTYKIDVKTDRQFISDTELAIQYPNDEYLDVKPEIILAQIIERNAEFTKDNFDIEVFEVTTGTFDMWADHLVEVDPSKGIIEELRPLKFRKPYSLVQDNILLDEKEVVVSKEPLTTEYVEYYFDIKVDNQIDKSLICSSISELGARGFYVDTEIECEETKNISLVDIYDTDAVSDPCPDLEDPCDDVPRTVY